MKRVDHLKKISGRKGTNPGGVYQDEKGMKFYIKRYKNENQCRSEVLACSIYREFGVPVADIQLAKRRGRVVTISKFLKGKPLLKENGTRDIHAHRDSKDIQDGFIIDCLLSNYDATGRDNILRVKVKPLAFGSGRRHIDYRIDNGGTMFFKAKGNAVKELFAEHPDEVPEIKIWRNWEKNPRPGRVFLKMKDKTIKKQALKLAAVFDDAKIDELVAAVDFDPPFAKKVIQYLRGRRDAIFEQLGLD